MLVSLNNTAKYFGVVGAIRVPKNCGKIRLQKI